MDNFHEVEYTNTVEDYLYSLGAFAGIYAGANTLQNLGSASVRPGWLLAGGHQVVPGFKSNFVVGAFGGNNLFERGFNKTLGKTALGKGLASAEGLNFSFMNFSYHSNEAYKAAGGMSNKQALLPGVNVTTKSRMTKHLNSIADFTEGANQTAIKKADDAVELATKNLFRAKDGTVVTIDNSYSKKVVNPALTSKAEEKLAASQKNLTEQLGKFSREEIIETGAKLKNGELDKFATGKAKEIVGTYTDEMLLKTAGESAEVIANDSLRKELIEKAEKKVGGQILQQSKNAAFAASKTGKVLTGLGRFGAKSASVFFSAPVQAAFAIESAVNISSTLRTNWQLKQIKEWQTSKQSQYFNPYTNAVIQKAGQITQNNNNELNMLLSSGNVAKGLAGKVGVN